ncbi:pentatricopeptide repeat domain-containing protein [Colletotrichum orchidophilum]|uniref:Pentatricopeptide repeat domain-containing protein n=1 Tax=Colletotrichum orchidophilum TaxID=1209926 RepID=A0A1G4ANX2_9PEZI|nr:pentatricopeptide repeat domain-containing protein [Colletotrichum orchidophilum]OHE90753.1 pentatricopeptide repeat domain-containing protein [Colletotrichum orchidophilum]
MLPCKACLTRALQPFSGKASFSEIPSALPALYHGPPGSQRRLAHRKATPTTAAGRAFLKEAQDIARTSDGDDKDLAEKRRKQKLDWAVSKHLEHLENPFNVAKHVEATLEKGRFDEALLLVQRASGKDNNLVVAWNHLIKYQIMGMKRVNYAISLFNDMKKRGQSPNEQTFTIIFTGCAKSRDPKAASPKALGIYKMMLKEDAKIQPNSIHLNAVLQCCGRAGDVENMFTLADTADAKSGRKNTAYTYTAIINTLRAEAENQDNRKGQSLQEHIETVEQAIKRCKQIWEEVMRNWRNGKLEIDEDLVCAMGRVLLLGGNQDRGRILSMLEETMSVRDYNRAPTGDDYAHRINDEMKGISVPGSIKRKATVLSPKIKYAVPRSNTLSLVLAIVREQRQTKLGVKYWDLFVHYYGVKPDTDNYHQMIRLYERSGSSKDAAKAVRLMPSDKPVPPIVYRRALSACNNNNMSQNAFVDATSVLNTMLAHGAAQKSPVDVRALLIYMKAGIICHFRFRQMDKAGDRKGAKRAYGEQLAAAVDNLWQPFTAAQEALIKSQGKYAARQRAEAVEDLADLARKMISAVDKVVNENTLTDTEALNRLKEKRSKLNRLAVEFTDPNQRMEDTASAKKDDQEMLDF